MDLKKTIKVKYYAVNSGGNSPKDVKCKGLCCRACKLNLQGQIQAHRLDVSLSQHLAATSFRDLPLGCHQCLSLHFKGLDGVVKVMDDIIVWVTQ